jgi:hypothetical protein
MSCACTNIELHVNLIISKVTDSTCYYYVSQNNWCQSLPFIHAQTTKDNKTVSKNSEGGNAEFPIAFV